MRISKMCLKQSFSHPKWVLQTILLGLLVNLKFAIEANSLRPPYWFYTIQIKKKFKTILKKINKEKEIN